MLNDNIEGNVSNPEEIYSVKPGDTALTVSRLAPMGKVMVNDLMFEAKSTGPYINQNTEVEIVKIEGNKLIVKPKT